MKCTLCDQAAVSGRGMCADCLAVVQAEVARNLAETPPPAALPEQWARALARLEGAAYTMANYYAEDGARRAEQIARAPLPERITAQRRFEQALADVRLLAADIAAVTA